MAWNDADFKSTFHQDAKGGESSTSKRESTAPTQEQIQEALEFLRMFRERETPSNEWEASAIDRLEKLVVAAVKAEPRNGEASMQEEQDNV